MKDLSSANQTLEKAPWPRGRIKWSWEPLDEGSGCDAGVFLLLRAAAAAKVVVPGGGVTVSVGHVGGSDIHGGFEVMIHPGTGSTWTCASCSSCRLSAVGLA